MDNDITPSDSRYIPFTQQRWCCVPTCIQIIMYKQGLPLIPTEVIGYHLGLIVPKEELRYFWNGRKDKKPIAGWGTQIRNPKYSPNEAFRKLKIPLRMKLILIDGFSDIESFKKYLSEVSKRDKDILICFDYGTLFDTNYHGGHVCVLDRVYIDKGEVRIIDPEYDAPKWRMVKIDRLFEAMKFHGQDKSAGFWELHKV